MNIEIEYKILCFLSLIIFIFLPIRSQAANIDPSQYLQLPEREDANIIHQFIQIFTDNWIDSMTSGRGDYMKEGIYLIMRQSARQRMAEYFLKEAPLDVLVEIIKAGVQLYTVYQTGDVGEIISKIEKITVKEARNYVTEWLLENEIRASSGTLTIDYDTYDNTGAHYEAPYIVLYKPIDNNTGELLVKVYSLSFMPAPFSKGSIDGSTGIYWEGDPHEQIPPFILTLQGKVRRSRVGYWKGEIIHNYEWIRTPQITIEFPEKMPDIKITKKGFFARAKDKFLSPFQKSYLAQSKAKEKAKNFFSEIGNSITDFFHRIKKKVANPFGASIGTRVSNLQFKGNEHPTKKDQKSPEGISEVDDNIKEESDTQSEPVLSEPFQENEPFQQEFLSDEMTENEAANEKAEQQFEEPQPQDDTALKKKDNNQVDDQETQQNQEDESKEQVQSLPPLLIAEVCAGMDSSKNEFIKIYNPNSQAIEINNENFILQLVSSKNKVTKKKIEWTRNIIPAKGFFLFASNNLLANGKTLQPDAQFSAGLTSVSGVIISDKTGRILDKVGWGKPDQPAPSQAVEQKGKVKSGGLKTGESLKRKKINYQYLDTDNNDNDFEFSSILFPENSLGEKLSFVKVSSSAPPVSSASPSNNSNQNSEEPAPQEENKQEENQQPEPFQKIFITEVQIEGENASQDFVELYNPNDIIIDLSSWQIKKKTSSGNESSLIVLPDGTAIAPHSYVLWASSKDDYHQEINADVSTSSYLSKNNSIALFDREKRIVDALAWGEGENQFVEGEAFSQNPDKNQTVSRKILDSGEYIDTDNNSQDFIIGKPTPRAKTQVYQSLSDKEENFDNENQNNAHTEKNENNENPPLETAHNLIISEVNTEDPEFIEIFNPTDKEISLSGKYLAYFSANREINNPYRVWEFEPELTIQAHSHFVILVYQKSDTIEFDWQILNTKGEPYSSGQLSDNSALGIFSCDPKNDDKNVAEGCAIDVVGWNDAQVKESKSALLEDNSQSLSRKTAISNNGILGYQDSNNNFQDFILTPKNPGTFSNPYIDLDSDGIANEYDPETVIAQSIELPVNDYHFQNLIVKSGGKIVVLSDKEKDFPASKIFVQNLTIEENGEISATGQGLEETIDPDLDFKHITHLGAGSSSSNNVQHLKGGGIVYIEAQDTITINGLINCSGEDNPWGSFDAASGGGIFLKSKQINGQGKILANGGKTDKANFGGDGGKIVLEVEENNFQGEIQAFGGNNQKYFDFKGRAGTIFIKTPQRETLIIKNDSAPSNFVKRHKEQLSPNLELDELILENIVVDFGNNTEFNVSNINIQNSQINLSAEKILKIFSNNVSFQRSQILANTEITASEIFIDKDSIISATAKGFDSNYQNNIEKDIFLPNFLAKGGNRADEKATTNRGGGKIIIQSKTLNLEGILEANGEKGKSIGWAHHNDINGGNGGAILIQTDTMSGTGKILANGGDDGPKSGDGGRIAIYFDENSFGGEINAYGGAGFLDREDINGGPGTIFLDNKKENTRTLIIDNNNHPGILDLSLYQLIQADLQTKVQSQSIVIVPKILGVQSFILENSELRFLSGANINVSGEFNIKNSLLSCPQKEILNIETDNLSLKTSEIKANLNIKARMFEMDDQSKITADLLGYNANEGPGKGEEGSGAGYGGRGGNYLSFLGGSVYGDSKQISEFGSGGGVSSNLILNNIKIENEGKGGGLVVLEISEECVIDGTISANGGEGGQKTVNYNHYPIGAGSGGGILIKTNSFKGKGNIIANGGESNGGGAGGGGRIAIFYNNSEFSGQIKADAGFCSNNLYCAEDGTIELVQE